MPNQIAQQPTHAAPTSLIAPYDTLTVVSQRSLNSQLKRAYDVTSLLQTATFKPTDDEDDEYSGFDVAFDAPTVELQLATENKIVVLLLNIKSGHLKYYKVSGRKVTEESLAVPPVTIALEVNLITESVPFASMPEDIQTRFASSKNLEIRKTLIDFKAASLARLRETQTTLHSVVADVSQSSLICGYITDYLQLLGQRQDEFIFHYIATVPSAEKAKATYSLPSIVPTGASAIQNLPINNSSAHASPGDDSLLAYLQMTNGSVLPRAQLPTSSKWISAAETSIDTPLTVISKSQFLDTSILSKLTEINKRSTWIADTTSCEASFTLTSVTYTLAGHLGWVDATEQQLAWVPVDSSVVSKDVCEKVEGAGAWYHYTNHTEKTATAKKIYEVTQKGKTDNWIFVPEGLNAKGKTEIALFGTTLVDFYTKLDLTGGSSGWVKSEWSTKIIFDSSKPGEPVSITTPDRILPTVTTETSDALLHEGELVRDVITPAKHQLERFEFDLQNLGQHLKRALEGDWPFFIPIHGGSVYVDRAFFSNGLDLVCELQQRQI